MRKWTLRMRIQFNIAAHEICAKLKPHGSVNRLYYMASSSSGQDERNRALHLPHYNAENDHRKRSHSITLSRVEGFANDAFCRVDWENDAIWKRWRHQNRRDRKPDHSIVSIQNGGQTLPCGFNFAPISRADLLKCACLEFIWACALRVSQRFQNGYGVVVWTGENDKCGRKSFWKRISV